MYRRTLEEKLVLQEPSMSEF